MTEKLNRLTGGSPFLLYTCLLTVLNVCLHKYSGRSVLVVGSPARKKAGAAQKINALAIVNQVEPTQTAQQLLLNVRAALLEAYERQSYPFERLVRDLKLEGLDSRCPLFDVALALKGFHLPLPAVKNDLTLTFEQLEGRVAAAVEFNPGLFARATVERFAGITNTCCDRSCRTPAARSRNWNC